MIQSFLLLSSPGGRQFFTLGCDRTASGLGEGKNLPRLQLFHLQMKQGVSGWEKVEFLPACDQPVLWMHSHSTLGLTGS